MENSQVNGMCHGREIVNWVIPDPSAVCERRDSATFMMAGTLIVGV